MLKSIIGKQQARLATKDALRKARAACKRKRRDHLRYLALKREKRILNRTLRDEFRIVLVEFRTLCADMREAERALRGVLTTRDQQSKQFFLGLEAGRLEARGQQIQAVLDQQPSSRRPL